MFYSSNDIKYGIFFNFLIKYIYPIMILFYPINIKNKENIYKDVNKSCIYISRHTLHNYELLLGLFTLNQHSPKLIRGLGHYLIYLLCPWYFLLGVIVGTKKNAEFLIKNNEYLFIIPGGAEEMTFGNENFYKTYWYSKSKKYKTGFAKLAYDNNLAVIPIHGKNVEYMIFSPFIYIANKLRITKLYHNIMIITNNLVIYKILFYIKMFFTMVFGCILIIPIPTKIEFIIGNHMYKEQNETLIEYTKRCEKELNKLIQEKN
jgi:hypothetical protein